MNHQGRRAKKEPGFRLGLHVVIAIVIIAAGFGAQKLEGYLRQEQRYKTEAVEKGAVRPFDAVVLRKTQTKPRPGEDPTHTMTLKFDPPSPYGDEVVQPLWRKQFETIAEGERFEVYFFDDRPYLPALDRRILPPIGLLFWVTAIPLFGGLVAVNLVRARNART